MSETPLNLRAPRPARSIFLGEPLLRVPGYPCHTRDMNTTPVGCKRAAARSCGTHFAALTEDHECKASCYRTSRHGGRSYIYTMCDAGHSVSMREEGPSLGGPMFAADLNSLPANAPFVLAAVE
jgi:hypothetical protein